MTTIHASSSRGAMLKLAAYAAQSPEHLTLEDTGLLIAGAIHFVIQLAWDTSGSAVRVQHPGDHRRRRPAGRQQRGMGARPGPPRRPGRPGPRRHHGRTGSRRVPARTLAGGMSAAAAGILGALAGLGVVLIVAGLRRAGAPEPSPRLGQLAGRVRQEATMPRVAATLVTMAVVAAVTRWPAGTVLAGLAAWFLPRALGPDREHARAAGADRGDRHLHRDAARHDLGRGRAGAGHPGRRAGRPRPGPRAGGAAGRPDPPGRAAAAGAARLRRRDRRPDRRPGGGGAAAGGRAAGPRPGPAAGQPGRLRPPARGDADAGRRRAGTGPHRRPDHHRRDHAAGRRPAGLEPGVPGALRHARPGS